MSDRPLDLTDLIPRFDGASSQGHLRDARSLVERLGDDGRRLMRDKPAAAERWVSGCQEMKRYIISYGRRREVDLATDLREFVHMFEHHMGRMLEMMLGLARGSPDDEELQLRVRQIRQWMDLTYRSATYAILARHIPDKQVVSDLRTHINLSTGAHRTEGTVVEPTVPKKYKHAAKRVW